MRHYPHQQAAHSNFSTPSNPTQYLQQHKSSSINNQQQTSTNTNKPIGIDTSNTDTYETLRADFVTSRYLTTGHSPNHERFHIKFTKEKVMVSIVIIPKMTLSSPADTQYETTLSINVDPSSSHKSSNINSLRTNTPPIAASPISSSVSPATSVSSNSAHPLKKRLLSEYEFEQQQHQRNSPTMISPVISTQTSPPISSTEEIIHNSDTSEQNTEENSNTDTTKKTTNSSSEKNESST
ncbi:unnamed protein product [Rotaria sp. Silwood1]|nr:unnamed protein product [Rotaria sp. Silwood1]